MNIYTPDLFLLHCLWHVLDIDHHPSLWFCVYCCTFIHLVCVQLLTPVLNILLIVHLNCISLIVIGPRYFTLPWLVVIGPRYFTLPWLVRFIYVEISSLAFKHWLFIQISEINHWKIFVLKMSNVRYINRNHVYGGRMCILF